MAHLLWDASGLGKNYAPELGSATVSALWAAVPPTRMALTFPGYAEINGILLRKRNRGELDAAQYTAAKLALRADIINNLDFVVLAVDTADFLTGIDLIERHNINSSDAAILASYLRYAPTTGDKCVLVAADGRLRRAARIEGLVALNPETLPAADVPAFLASL